MAQRGQPRPSLAAQASGALNVLAGLTAWAALVAVWPFEIRVVDGDTVDRWPWRYRLAGFDTPEIRRAACPTEKAAGIDAAAKLRSLIDAAVRVEIVPTGRARDQWRRIPARLLLDGRDVSEIAISEGWGVHYAGSGERHDWCTD